MSNNLILGAYPVSPFTRKVINDDYITKVLEKQSWSLNQARIVYVDENTFKKDALKELDWLTTVKRISFVSTEEKSNDKTKDKNTRVEIEQLRTQFSSLIQNESDQYFINIEKGNSVRFASNAAYALLKTDCKAETFENTVYVDSFDQYASYSAEGVVLESFQFDLNSEKHFEKMEKLKFKCASAEHQASFEYGVTNGRSQNFARYLQELPANYCTPTKFCNIVKNFLVGRCKLGEKYGDKLKVQVHSEEWAQNNKMNSFLSVSSGSEEEARILEASFMNNKDSKEIDIVLLGKGITFDAGGISIKPSENMRLMKSDMGGAAVVCGTFLGVLNMNLPLNIVALTMMSENLISGKATKPGDVVTAMNGKTIEVDNTDAEGRLALADGLCYASLKNPKYLIDLATLTCACIIALGSPAAACYTQSNDTWNIFERKGYESDDYFWRMPLFRKQYRKQLTDLALSADLNNIGGRAAGSCTAAVFLSEFVDFDKVKNYVHLDIASVNIVGTNKFTGRPTRSLLSVVEEISKQK